MQTESTNSPEKQPRVVPLLGPSNHTDISLTPGQDTFEVNLPLPVETYQQSLQAQPATIQVRLSEVRPSCPSACQ